MKPKTPLPSKTNPEAPKDADFGEYLFAPERSGDVPLEPNTNTEEKLFAALKSFISDNSATRLKTLIPKIRSAIEKHQYKPLLDPENIKVYRAVSMPVKDLENLLEPYGMKLVRNKFVTCSLPGQLPALRQRILQSWSSMLSSLNEFVFGWSTTTAVVIFVARTNAEGNTFFGKPWFLANVVFPDHASEFETISIGAVEHDGFAYYIPSQGGYHFSQDDLYRAARKVK
jgi:hypothetical protein